ncbi:MAG: CDP-paratose 2-epimerase [Candidatus Eisenbacteria bacterium]|nr:CDP-paratose 2-epimerase [Candidatus Eisenbacteria bacterium]
MTQHILERECVIPGPVDAVFEFVADARNLNAITPPWLKIQIVSPDNLEMRAGLVIEYRMWLRWIPFHWESEITQWGPPHRFTEVQRRGPYKSWVHAHVFEDHPEGTLLTDLVTYTAPGGRMVRSLLVTPDLERIFDYRQEKLIENFATGRAGRAETA